MGAPSARMGAQPAGIAYRSPADAARDVADLLPPVVPPVAPPRRQAQAPSGLLAGAPRQPEWQPQGLGLISLAVGVAAVALSILLPIAGTVLSLAVITLLRAVDRAQSALSGRRSLHGSRVGDIAIVILAAPWTVVRAALTTVFLAPLALVPALLAAGASVIFARTATLPSAGSWAAGAAVAFYCVGPGSATPRRQLRRISASIIRSRAALAVAFISSWALALAVVTSAFSQPPLIWPATSSTLPHLMPGLPSLGGMLHSVQGWLLRHTVGMLHLPWAVLGKGPYQPKRDHLVGEASAPVGTLGYPELHVQPEQVLLDRRLSHDQIASDLFRRGGCDEGFVGERRTAQWYQHVKLASRQLWCRGAAKLRLDSEIVMRQSLDSAAGGAEADDVTVVKHPASDWAPVHPSAVTW
jgi:hypothetical protein